MTLMMVVACFNLNRLFFPSCVLCVLYLVLYAFIYIYMNCVCWCLSSPYLSSAMPGCAACALVTGAPSACVRTSSTLSCCRRSGPNSTLWYSEGPLYLLHSSLLLPVHFSSFHSTIFFAKLLNLVASVSQKLD